MKLIKYIYQVQIVIIRYWNKFIPSPIRKVLASTELTITICLIMVVAIGYLIVYNSNFPYLTYGINNPEAKGNMLSIYLSICGGLTVLYGLFLNHKKLNEQTRQNDIAFTSNNDKRFGEAIGYLNSNNIGIAIGGVYTLYQLAKEEKRYTPIVANIFVEMLPNLAKTKKKEIYDIIVEKLFSDTFKNIEITFKGLEFENLTLQTAKSIQFERCTFLDIELVNGNNLTFTKCTFNNVLLENINNIIIEKCKIDYLILQNMYPIEGLMINCCDINRCIVNCNGTLSYAFFEDNIITSFLEIKAKLFDDVNVSNNKKIKVCSENPQNINIIGDKSKPALVSFTQYEGWRIYYLES